MSDDMTILVQMSRIKRLEKELAEQRRMVLQLRQRLAAGERILAEILRDLEGRAKSTARFLKGQR